MTDLNLVKSRIRKLLAIAADDANPDGETKTARKLAERAMKAYRLSHADLVEQVVSSVHRSPSVYRECTTREDVFDEALCGLEEAIDAIGDIEAASEFVASISEKCESFREYYESRGSLTDAQLVAVENMTRGARRWVWK